MKQLTPLQVIRRRCLECVVYSSEVTKCTGKFINGETCALHPYRFGKKPVGIQNRPLKAIRAFCLWCMSGSVKEVRLCGSGNCALIDWRLGCSPNKHHRMTDARKAALTKAREKLLETPSWANENDSKINEDADLSTEGSDQAYGDSGVEKPEESECAQSSHEFSNSSMAEEK